jgi:ABC-2 type transport system permease protein
LDVIGVTAGSSKFMLAAGTLWQREMVRFFRQRSRIAGALGTPLIFWALLGSGLGGSFKEYFFPGAVVQVLLFTAIFSTISIIEDRREGFLQSVLVAPISRGSIVLGKIMGGATLATLQGLVFMLFAPAAGISLTPTTGLLTAVALFLISFGLTGLGFLIAWPMQSTQGFHAIMNLLLLPMWVLSGALFPMKTAAVALKVLMYINPLTYGLSLLRNVIYHGADKLESGLPGYSVSLVVTLAFAAVAYIFSWYLACRRTTIPA